MNISLSAFAPENLVPRDEFGSPVPRQPAHLHARAESSSYLRDTSRVPRRRPFIYLIPPYAIGSVRSLSGYCSPRHMIEDHVLCHAMVVVVSSSNTLKSGGISASARTIGHTLLESLFIMHVWSHIQQE